MPHIVHERGKNMKYLVIKCGGSVYETLPTSFYKSIIQVATDSEWTPIIVHGGGPKISKLCEQLNIESTFYNGLRVTSQEVLEVAEMVLNGSINKEIVTKIHNEGGKAIGLSGLDGHLLVAEPLKGGKLGFVGEVKEVHASILAQVAEQGFIPVISPIASDNDGQHYNINGDMAAAAIAGALGAKLCFVSNVPGIWIDKDGERTILSEVSDLEIKELIKKKIISGGMVPKVISAIESLQNDVKEVSIISGHDEESIKILTSGGNVGTKVFLEEGVTYVG